MKLYRHPRASRHGGAIIAYLILALIVMVGIAAVSSYLVANVGLAHRRQNMVSAFEFAQGGAAIACANVQTAFTNGSSSLLSNIVQSCCGSYVKDKKESSPSQLVYARKIGAPFSGQTVVVQLIMTNTPTPPAIQVVSRAVVGNSSQSVQVNLALTFAFGAAIISTAQGDLNSSVGKGTAQGGDVVVSGNNPQVTKVVGGIMANGAVNTNQCAIDSVQKALSGTANQIPDYTSPGSLYQLFDFNRFIAVADVLGQHYPNGDAFIAQAKSRTLEGVIAVDIPYGTNPKLDATTLPNGINIHGTLVFNFCPNSRGQNWAPLDKVVNEATMNINAANLVGLNPNNPATYPSGYPPTYTDPSKNPINVDIRPKGYPNFTAVDDLPALMYNNAILDMHGNVNISGVVYSSSFMEIENKHDGQTQYFRGALIGGGGIYFENNQTATSIISYDPKAMNNLATAGARGKTLAVVFQQ